MRELYNQAMLLIEDDATWLHDAAGHCAQFVRDLSEEERSKWGLLVAMYQTRAKTHQELAVKMRHALRVDRSTDSLSAD